MCWLQRHDLEGLFWTCAGLKGEYDLQNDCNLILILTGSVTVLNQSLAREDSV